MRTAFSVDCSLPVDFLHFEAERVGSVVNLDWATASETDAASFVVERSWNGTDYVAIGQLEARNTSSGAVYEWIDKYPANAPAYYRLRQLDINGDFNYSVVRYVAFISLGDLVLLPNPAQDQVKLLLPSEVSDKSNVSVQLFNTLGQALYTRNINAAQLNQGLTIDLNSFSKGAYLIKVITLEGEWIERLMKE
jgi:hypothetical protein